LKQCTILCNFCVTYFQGFEDSPSIYLLSITRSQRYSSIINLPKLSQRWNYTTDLSSPEEDKKKVDKPIVPLSNPIAMYYRLNPPLEMIEIN
jgi:hypothetical protein